MNLLCLQSVLVAIIPCDPGLVGIPASGWIRDAVAWTRRVFAGGGARAALGALLPGRVDAYSESSPRFEGTCLMRDATKYSMHLRVAIGLVATLAALAFPAAAQTPAQPAEQTRAQALFGDVNPKLADLTDNVLFGDIWKRPGLSPRDRSLVTVAALIAMDRPDQLRSHLQRARDNGLSEVELIEAITHLAFYAGWPSGVSASIVAKEVFQQKK